MWAWTDGWAHINSFYLAHFQIGQTTPPPLRAVLESPTSLAVNTQQSLSALCGEGFDSGNGCTHPPMRQVDVENGKNGVEEASGKRKNGNVSPFLPLSLPGCARGQEGGFGYDPSMQCPHHSLIFAIIPSPVLFQQKKNSWERRKCLSLSLTLSYSQPPSVCLSVW